MTKSEAFAFMKNGFEVYHKSQTKNLFSLVPEAWGGTILLNGHTFLDWDELPTKGWAYKFRYLKK